MIQTKPIISCVGAVIFRGDDILLIQRANPPFQHHWSIPGGKIHHGEAIEHALRREIREETNVEIEILGLIDVFEALPKSVDDAHYLMIDYACRYVSGDMRAGDDAEDAGFFPLPEALSRMAWDKTRIAIQSALAFTRNKALD